MAAYIPPDQPYTIILTDQATNISREGVIRMPSEVDVNIILGRAVPKENVDSLRSSACSSHENLTRLPSRSALSAENLSSGLESKEGERLPGDPSF